MPPVYYAAVGEAGAPAAPGGAGDPAGGQPSPSDPPAPPGTPEARPDFIPEKFWDTDAGSVRLEELAKAHKTLESNVGLTEQAIRDKMEPELREKLGAERLVNRPKTPEDYKVELAKDVVPEGIQFEVDTQNELFQFWRKFAHEQGFDQEQFNTGISAYVKGLTRDMPNAKEELAKLGENGTQRIEAAQAWSKANLSEGTYEEITGIVSTAAGLKAVEEIMAKVSQRPMTTEGGSPANAKTLVQLREMMNDPRYYDPSRRDDAYIAEVGREFEKAYPGTHTSGQRGLR